MSSNHGGKAQGQSTDGYHKRFLAGAFTGALVKTIVAPVERLKLLWETQTMFVPVSKLKYTSIRGAIKTVHAEEGLSGFFRGNLVNIIRTAPNSAIKFMTYDLYSNYLGAYFGNDEHAFLRALTSGALSGASQVAVTYPLDVVRSRVMLGKGYNGVIDCIRRTYTEEGYRAFYRGLPATLMGVMPYVAISFAVYDWTKRLFKHEEMLMRYQLLFAATASLCAGTITVPIDVVRRRLQLQGSVHRKEIMYTGAFDAFRKIYAAEGVRGLYRGVSFQVLRSVPATSLQLVIYDFLKRRYNLH